MKIKMELIYVSMITYTDVIANLSGEAAQQNSAVRQ